MGELRETLMYEDTAIRTTDELASYLVDSFPLEWKGGVTRKELQLAFSGVLAYLRQEGWFAKPFTSGPAPEWVEFGMLVKIRWRHINRETRKWEVEEIQGPFLFWKESCAHAAILHGGKVRLGELIEEVKS